MLNSTDPMIHISFELKEMYISLRNTWTGSIPTQFPTGCQSHLSFSWHTCLISETKSPLSWTSSGKYN